MFKGLSYQINFLIEIPIALPYESLVTYPTANLGDSDQVCLIPGSIEGNGHEILASDVHLQYRYFPFV